MGFFPRFMVAMGDGIYTLLFLSLYGNVKWKAQYQYFLFLKLSCDLCFRFVVTREGWSSGQTMI